MDVQKIYEKRFNGESVTSRKNKIWQTLCNYFFQKFIPQNACVVDVAAGSCEFINNIKAERKVAFDINPDGKNFASEEVEFINKSLFELGNFLDSKADILFCSNTLEHLKNKEEVISAFRVFNQSLKKGGRLLILQPNIKYTKGQYWDFIDHIVPLTDKALIEAGEINGFECVYNLERFLPYTTKSKKPQYSWLIRLYLLLMPFSGCFFGEQSFLVLEKIND